MLREHFLRLCCGATLLTACVSQSTGGIPQRMYPPVIVSVVPSFGSAEGEICGG